MLLYPAGWDGVKGHNNVIWIFLSLEYELRDIGDSLHVEDNRRMVTRTFAAQYFTNIFIIRILA